MYMCMYKYYQGEKQGFATTGFVFLLFKSCHIKLHNNYFCRNDLLCFPTKYQMQLKISGDNI